MPIADVAVGDAVSAWDEATQTTGVYTVTDTINHVDPLILQVVLDNETVDTTPEHPFSTVERGWVPAEDLRRGDTVPSRDGTDGTVLRVTRTARIQPMYNLTVAKAHTFYVGDGGWLVHNTGCPKVVRRFTSRDEVRQARRRGIDYREGDPGISATTTNIRPARPDRIRQLTGARYVDYYMDIRTEGKTVLEYNTKGGLPDYKIRSRIDPDDIVDYGRVERQ